MCTPNLFTPYSPKVLVIPRNRWLRLNMTEKLFTGTLNHNQNKTPNLWYFFGSKLETNQNFSAKYEIFRAVKTIGVY